MEHQTTRNCGTCAWWWRSQDGDGDCGKGYGPTRASSGSKCPDHSYVEEVSADVNGR